MHIFILSLCLLVCMSICQIFCPSVPMSLPGQHSSHYNIIIYLSPPTPSSNILPTIFWKVEILGAVATGFLHWSEKSVCTTLMGYRRAAIIGLDESPTGFEYAPIFSHLLFLLSPTIGNFENGFRLFRHVRQICSLRSRSSMHKHGEQRPTSAWAEITIILCRLLPSELF